MMKLRNFVRVEATLRMMVSTMSDFFAGYIDAEIS